MTNIVYLYFICSFTHISFFLVQPLSSSSLRKNVTVMRQARTSSTAFRYYGIQVFGYTAITYPEQRMQGITLCKSLLIHRTRLSVSFTGRLRCILRQVDAPSCSHCHLENLEHILLHCPHYQTSRTTLTVSLSQLDPRPLSMRKLLDPWANPAHQRTAVRSLLAFLQSAALYSSL